MNYVVTIATLGVMMVGIVAKTAAGDDEFYQFMGVPDEFVGSYTYSRETSTFIGDDLVAESRTTADLVMIQWRKVAPGQNDVDADGLLLVQGRFENLKFQSTQLELEVAPEAEFSVQFARGKMLRDTLRIDVEADQGSGLYNGVAGTMQAIVGTILAHYPSETGVTLGAGARWKSWKSASHHTIYVFQGTRIEAEGKVAVVRLLLGDPGTGEFLIDPNGTVLSWTIEREDYLRGENMRTVIRTTGKRVKDSRQRNE